jgi:hypothetical protein
MVDGNNKDDIYLSIKNGLPMPSPAGLLKTTSYLLLLVLLLRLLRQ